MQVELSRWVGPELIKAVVLSKGLRDTAKEEVERDMLEARAGPKPLPERRTRREQAKLAVAVEAPAADAVVASNGQAVAAALEEGAAEVRVCMVVLGHFE